MREWTPILWMPSQRDGAGATLLTPPEALLEDFPDPEAWVGGSWDRRESAGWTPEDGLEPTAYSPRGKLLGYRQCCETTNHGARCSKPARALGRFCTRHENASIRVGEAQRKRKAIGAANRRDAGDRQATNSLTTPRTVATQPRYTGRHYHAIARALGPERADRYAQLHADQHALTDPYASLALMDTMLDDVLAAALRYGDTPDWRLRLVALLDAWAKMPSATEEDETARQAAWEEFESTLRDGASHAEAIGTVRALESERATRNERTMALQLKSTEYVQRRELEGVLRLFARVVTSQLAPDPANAVLDEVQRQLQAGGSAGAVDALLAVEGLSA